jgi:hypothetical protein
LSVSFGQNGFIKSTPQEELGINPDYIVQKTLTVLNPFRATRVDVAADSDLAGPLVNISRRSM